MNRPTSASAALLAAVVSRKVAVKNGLKKSRRGWGCARSVGLHALLGGKVMGTLPAAPRGRTRGHAPGWHHGRLAPPGTGQIGPTRRDWYGRARLGFAARSGGHDGRLAPAGTHPIGTTRRHWYQRAHSSRAPRATTGQRRGMKCATAGSTYTRSYGGATPPHGSPAQRWASAARRRREW